MGRLVNCLEKWARHVEIMDEERLPGIDGISVSGEREE